MLRGNFRVPYRHRRRLLLPDVGDWSCASMRRQLEPTDAGMKVHGVWRYGCTVLRIRGIVGLRLDRQCGVPGASRLEHRRHRRGVASGQEMMGSMSLSTHWPEIISVPRACSLVHDGPARASRVANPDLTSFPRRTLLQTRE